MAALRAPAPSMAVGVTAACLPAQRRLQAPPVFGVVPAATSCLVTTPGGSVVRVLPGELRVRLGGGRWHVGEPRPAGPRLPPGSPGLPQAVTASPGAFQNQLLTKGMVILRDKIRFYEGEWQPGQTVRWARLLAGWLLGIVAATREGGTAGGPVGAVDCQPRLGSRALGGPRGPPGQEGSEGQK